MTSKIREKVPTEQSSNILRKPQKFEKIFHLILILLIHVKTSEMFFQILWPIHNI